MKQIIVTKTAAELSPYLSQWQDLADNCSEYNPFFEPGYLIPALNHLKKNTDLKVVLVFTNDSESAERRLIGLIPLRRRFGYRGFAVKYMHTWEHMHCFLGTPLVRSGCEREFTKAFLTWIDTQSEALVELRLFASNSAFSDALDRDLILSDRSVDVIADNQRAFFNGASSVESFEQNNFSSKKLKDFRRKKRRLAEHGEVKFEALREAKDALKWYQEFLILEGKGWKGQNGTALIVDPLETKYFEEVVKSAAEKGELHFLRLRAGDKTVAMNLCTSKRECLYCLKIAFDEDYSACSVGKLLALDMVKYVIEHSQLETIDSCASHESSFLNEMLGSFKELRYMNIGTDHPLSDLTLRTVPPVRRLYHSCSMNAERLRTWAGTAISGLIGL